MKKTLILLLVTVLLFSSCAKGGEHTETATTEATTAPTEAPEPVTENPYAPIGDETTFLLPALPDIGEYEADELNRWYEGPMPELIPSGEYGELCPYLGAVRKYSTYSVLYNDVVTFSRRYYGLCTADGTLVTDPIYTSCSYNDGRYLLVTEYADETAEIYSRACIAASDGSQVTLIHDGEGIPQYCAPDVYGVIDGADIGVPTPFRYLHADGTEYDTDIYGVIEYECGFLLFREYDNGFKEELSILDKELNVISGYVFRDHGAEGEVIAMKEDEFVVLDRDGKELYTTEHPLWYDEGRYMIKSEEDKLTFLDENMAPEKTVTYPTEIYNVFCGYVKGRDWYYTFSGEKTEYSRIEQRGEVYFFRSDSGTLIRSGDEEFFFKSERQVAYAVIYDHAVAVSLKDGYGAYLFDRDDGKLIGELNSFDERGYMFEGERERSYTVPVEGEYVFRAQNGVFTTFTPDGKVLVKIHSDTE